MYITVYIIYAECSHFKTELLMSDLVFILPFGKNTNAY